MQITKIKNLNDEVFIEWKTNCKTGGFNVNSVRSKDKAVPEFYEALEALRPHLIELCELKKYPEEDFKTTGISLSFKGENDQKYVTIKGMRSYKKSSGCQALNTPTKAAEIEGDQEKQKKDILSDEAIEAVDRFIKAAEGFIKGERTQTNMFDEDNENEDCEE